jgi:division protein CdvB (Snf7/Vps24/ESCRT-III family)
MVTESGGATAFQMNNFSSSEEAEKILTDANAIAEQRMKEKFPTLPSTDLPSLEGST